MEIFIILLIVVAIIVLATISKPQQPNKYFIAQLNHDRQKQSDDLYESIKRQHSNIALHEIRPYIESRRQEDDNYWGYHRMEYKILMEREKKLVEKEISRMQTRVANADFSQLSLSECDEWINEIEEKLPGQFLEEISKLWRRKEAIVFGHHVDELKRKNYRDVKGYLREIKKMYGFLPEALTNEGEKIQQQEPALTRLKRERKNYQSALAKARKQQNQALINKYEKLLAENTIHLNKQKSKLL